MHHTRAFRWLSLLVAVIVLGAGIALPVQAQDSASLPFAAVSGGNLWLYGLASSPVQVTTTGTLTYSDLVWSPDGNMLAFTMPNADYQLQLMITDRTGRDPVQLASGLAYGLPISFTDDGSQIIYAASTGEYVNQPDGSAAEKTIVYGVAPAAGAAPVELGNFLMGVGCGGGSSIPADALYWAESNTGPAVSSTVMALTSFGLVHSTSCIGIGTAVLDLSSGQDTVLDPTLGWASVSPDRTQVLGIRREARDSSGMVTVIDLASGAANVLGVAVEPDLVAWGPASAQEIFYSTRQESGTIPVPEQGQSALAQVIGAAGNVNLPKWSVSLHRFDIESGEDTELYAGDAYAIGRMQPTPDGQTVVFSQVPNLEKWVEAVTSGQIDPTTQAGQQALMQAVAVELYRLDTASGSASLIGTDLAEAALNDAAMTG